MQVLHVSPRYYPYIGGSETYCQEMSERLVQAGHAVTVLTTDAWDVEYFGDPRRQHMPCGSFDHRGVQVVLPEFREQWRGLFGSDRDQQPARGLGIVEQ